MVRSLSNTQECGFPTMSIDTNGSVENSSMPFNAPLAAALNAALISSLVFGLRTLQVKSVTEPSGIGTRIALPLSLPFKCGITKPTALAAPVLVGMMLYAAALALRKSL